jgi:hypothetical protein
MGISNWNITWRNTPWLQFAMQKHQFKWVYHLYGDYISNQNNSIIWTFGPFGIIYLSNNHSSVVLETRKYAVNVIELPSWKHFSSFLEVTIFLYVPNLLGPVSWIEQTCSSAPKWPEVVGWWSNVPPKPAIHIYWIHELVTPR